MMKTPVSWISRFCLLATWLWMTGCVEVNQSLHLKKDGSGVMVLRIIPSPQAAEWIGGLYGDGAADSDRMLEDLKALLQKPEALGAGSTLISLKPVSNVHHWNGFEAAYALPNVDSLDVDALVHESPLDGIVPKIRVKREASSGAFDLRFQDFLPEDTSPATGLPVNDSGQPAGIPEVESPEKEIPAGEADDPALEEPVGEIPEEVARLWFEGLRVSSLVVVEGEIEKTNASFVNKDESGALLLDINFDQFLDHPKRLQALQNARTPGDLKALGASRFPGIRIQDPTEPLRIELK